MTDIDMWGLSRKTAAEIVGLTDAQLKNFQQRYVIFPEKREGTGNPVTYNLHALIKLAAFAQMMADGFPAPSAAEAVSPYSVYASLFERRNFMCPVPGTFFLSKNHDGRWVGMDGQDIVSRYEIRTWVLFDRVWPKFREAILAIDSPHVSLTSRETALEEYFTWMSQRREEAWK